MGDVGLCRYEALEAGLSQDFSRLEKASGRLEGATQAKMQALLAAHCSQAAEKADEKGGGGEAELFRRAREGFVSTGLAELREDRSSMAEVRLARLAAGFGLLVPASEAASGYQKEPASPSGCERLWFLERSGVGKGPAADVTRFSKDAPTPTIFYLR